MLFLQLYQGIKMPDMVFYELRQGSAGIMGAVAVAHWGEAYTPCEHTCEVVGVGEAEFFGYFIYRKRCCFE